MRHNALALLLALVLVPAAAAEYYEGKPDCPPDMFCTESAPLGDEVASSGAGGSATGFAVLAALGALAVVFAVRRR